MYNARLQGGRIRSNKTLFIFSSSSKYFFFALEKYNWVENGRKKAKALNQVCETIRFQLIDNDESNSRIRKRSTRQFRMWTWFLVGLPVTGSHETGLDRFAKRFQSSIMVIYITVSLL